MNLFLATALAAAQTAASGSSSPAPEAHLAPAPTTPLTVVTPLPACCLLPKMTAVYLAIDEPVASDRATVGQRFKIRLSSPIFVAEGLTIPAGTVGEGEIVHAAKSRAMGKAGELLLAARYLDHQGTRIPLRSFRFGRPQGKDNADTAVIVGIAVSALLTPFITGGEVRIPAGAEAWAKVAVDTTFPSPLAASPTPAAPVQPTSLPDATTTQGEKK